MPAPLDPEAPSECMVCSCGEVYYTVYFSARFAGVHTNTIYKALKDGKLAGAKLTSGWMVRGGSLRKWMSDRGSHVLGEMPKNAKLTKIRPGAQKAQRPVWL